MSDYKHIFLALVQALCSLCKEVLSWVSTLGKVKFILALVHALCRLRKNCSKLSWISATAKYNSILALVYAFCRLRKSCSKLSWTSATAKYNSIRSVNFAKAVQNYHEPARLQNTILFWHLYTRSVDYVKAVQNYLEPATTLVEIRFALYGYVACILYWEYHHKNNKIKNLNFRAFLGPVAGADFMFLRVSDRA